MSSYGQIFANYHQPSNQLEYFAIIIETDIVSNEDKIDKKIVCGESIRIIPDSE